MFLVFFLPLFAGLRNIGNLVGIVVSAAIVGYSVFTDKINGFFKDLEKSRAGRVIRILCACFAALAVIITVWMTALMVSPGRSEVPDEACVIVLGCQVNGQDPSRMLAQRLEGALLYLEEHPDFPCIVSGGRGGNENLSEAECMYNWLTERGVDPERIYMEPDSRNTYENISNSCEIIEKYDLPRDVVIVTNGFHQYRAGFFAEERGCRAYQVRVPTDIAFLPSLWIREMMAIFGKCILGIN